MADFRLSEIDQKILDTVVEVGNSTSRHTRYFEENEDETPPDRLEGERGFEEVFPLFAQRQPGDTPMMTFMMALSIARGSTTGVVRGLGLAIPGRRLTGRRRQRRHVPPRRAIIRSGGVTGSGSSGVRRACRATSRTACSCRASPCADSPIEPSASEGRQD